MDNLKFGVNLFGQNPDAGDEYPKMLYLGEASVVVASTDEESAAIAEGFAPLSVHRVAAPAPTAPDPRDTQLAQQAAELAELRAMLEQATKPRIGRPPKAVEPIQE